MQSFAPGWFIWAVAAAIFCAIGLVLLRACDLEIFPLYAHNYCAAPLTGALTEQRSRYAELQAELRQAELSLEQKPKCAPTPEPPKVIPQHEPPQVNPQPEPQPEPQPQLPEQQKLKVPKKLSGLRGCWESVRGDLPIVTDNAEQRPVGSVRECYCFGGDGRGVIKLLYTNGVKCRAPITVRLESGKLRMAYPRFSCLSAGKDWGLVPADITCENGDDSGGATCTTYGHGRISKERIAQYHRVEQDHCGN